MKRMVVAHQRRALLAEALLAAAGLGLCLKGSDGAFLALEPVDPDALVLSLANVDQSCGFVMPEPSIGDCTANRRMVLGLPPALQNAGEVSLTDPAIDAIYTALENSCSTAAPDDGTLTISSVSETAIAVRIYGSGWAAFDGDYAVTVCP